MKHLLKLMSSFSFHRDILTFKVEDNSMPGQCQMLRGMNARIKVKVSAIRPSERSFLHNIIIYVNHNLSIMATVVLLS